MAPDQNIDAHNTATMAGTSNATAAVGAMAATAVSSRTIAANVAIGPIASNTSACSAHITRHDARIRVTPWVSTPEVFQPPCVAGKPRSEPQIRRCGRRFSGTETARYGGRRSEPHEVGATRPSSYDPA